LGIFVPLPLSGRRQIEAAKTLGVLVLTLTPRAGGAGDFALSGN